ncbi:radical SAM protein [Candidatus Woesearchaeota archaeon]|nr:radical SAM protein [Candidatus Woesearchaeota archaeon]MBT6518282.1 radical SAM protein [Candidatus Woesearchaeota archaeon]MBT7367065.1 radical SAM protein [Candidatus Woesearchaeota archaeon]
MVELKKLKKLKRPIVMYSITEECQLRCKHCYNESGESVKNCDPSTEELFRVTENLAKVAGAINFTGGEPFLRKELPDLLELSAEYGVDNIVTSNGLRLMETDAHQLLERIEPNLYMFKVGVMGATPKTNDYIRGKGQFETAMKALDLMANYDFVSCMKISLDKHNKHELEDFVKLAIEHRADEIVFGQLVEIGRASKFLSDLVLSVDELHRANDDIYQLREKYKGVVKLARHCTISGLCQDEGHFYTVNSRGGMSPCLMREDLAIGDVAKMDSQNILYLMESIDKSRKVVKTHNSIKDDLTDDCCKHDGELHKTRGKNLYSEVHL